MKNKNYYILVIGAVFIISGMVGQVFSNRGGLEGLEGRGPFRTSGLMHADYFDGDTQMPFRNFENYSENQEKLPLEVLKDQVNKYLDNYETELVISDIFTFEDSDYYFSILEKESAMGAMELLVNPYSSAVYPEYGPNMMWNLKYGMHSNGGRMSGRGMMGSSRYNENPYQDDVEDNKLSHEEAFEYGAKYLQEYKKNLALADEYHEFYGYYTFHVKEDDKTVGMLSVNGFTGQVWYHDWHGDVMEVMDQHD